MRTTFHLDDIQLTVLPGIHYEMPGEFLPLCQKPKKPQEIVGCMWSGNSNKAETTCQECLELMHS